MPPREDSIIFFSVSWCDSLPCLASAEALHHEAVWLLFGVPRLWVFTKVDVQLGVYDVLHLVVERKPQAFLAVGTSGEQLWEHCFALLTAFSEREGGCKVPARHEEEGVSLGEWLVTQRAAHTNDTLGAARRTRLEALGVV